MMKLKSANTNLAYIIIKPLPADPVPNTTLHILRLRNEVTACAMLCSLVKNAEHGAIQDEAERMYVLEETVLCMVESLHFLRKLSNVP